MSSERPAVDHAVARRHQQIGWWSLAIFATLGLALETLHGLKIGFYLDVGNDTRRLLWTLAHAHGALVGVLHVLFGLTVRQAPASVLTSRCLTLAGLLLPAGFFLGGIGIHGGDPGLGVLLVPLGGALLVTALIRMALATGAALAPGEPPKPPGEGTKRR
jgi:hypothetical protein